VGHSFGKIKKIFWEGIEPHDMCAPSLCTSLKLGDTANKKGRKISPAN
jgi:hypothetical protein